MNDKLKITWTYTRDGKTIGDKMTLDDSHGISPVSLNAITYLCEVTREKIIRTLNIKEDKK